MCAHACACASVRVRASACVRACLRACARAEFEQEAERVQQDEEREAEVDRLLELCAAFFSVPSHTIEASLAATRASLSSPAASGRYNRRPSAVEAENTFSPPRSHSHSPPPPSPMSSMPTSSGPSQPDSGNATAQPNTPQLRPSGIASWPAAGAAAAAARSPAMEPAASMLVPASMMSEEDDGLESPDALGSGYMESPVELGAAGAAGAGMEAGEADRMEAEEAAGREAWGEDGTGQRARAAEENGVEYGEPGEVGTADGAPPWDEGAGGAAGDESPRQEVAAHEGTQDQEEDEDEDEDELNVSFGPRPPSAASMPDTSDLVAEESLLQESLLEESLLAHTSLAAPMLPAEASVPPQDHLEPSLLGQLGSAEAQAPEPHLLEARSADKVHGDNDDAGAQLARSQHEAGHQEAGDAQEDALDQEHATLTASPAENAGGAASAAPRWAASRMTREALGAEGQSDPSASSAHADADASPHVPQQDVTVHEYTSDPDVEDAEQDSTRSANASAPFSPEVRRGTEAEAAESSRQAAASWTTSAGTASSAAEAEARSSPEPPAARAHETLAHAPGGHEAEACGREEASGSPSKGEGEGEGEVASDKTPEPGGDEAQRREREEVRQRMREEARKIKEAAALASSPSALSPSASSPSASAASSFPQADAPPQTPQELPASAPPMAGGGVKSSDSRSLSAAEAAHGSHEVGLECLQRVATLQEQPADDI